MSDNNKPDDLDEAFRLLTDPAAKNMDYESLKRNDRKWKETDPDSYKKDMEQMCRDMFGENWKVQYEAMLKEEFPDDYQEDSNVR
jgi:hypothetical protein